MPCCLPLSSKPVQWGNQLIELHMCCNWGMTHPFCALRAAAAAPVPAPTSNSASCPARPTTSFLARSRPGQGGCMRACAYQQNAHYRCDKAACMQL